MPKGVAYRRTFGPPPAGKAGLGPRHMRIIDLIQHGNGTHEIARALKISEGTLKVYISQALKVVGVRNRQELARRFGGDPLPVCVMCSAPASQDLSLAGRPFE